MTIEEQKRVLLTIVGMGLVTYLPRLIPLLLRCGRRDEAEHGHQSRRNHGSQCDPSPLVPGEPGNYHCRNRSRHQRWNLHHRHHRQGLC